MVLAKLWSWLSSDQGVQLYEELDPALSQFGCPRTVQRWASRLVPDGVALEQALRTAVIERFDRGAGAKAVNRRQPVDGPYGHSQ